MGGYLCFVLRQKVEHRYKTKMCKYFLAGHCPYVATGTCQFAHSRDELMAGRGSIHRAEYMNVGPAGTLPGPRSTGATQRS